MRLLRGGLRKDHVAHSVNKCTIDLSYLRSLSTYHTSMSTIRGDLYVQFGRFGLYSDHLGSHSYSLYYFAVYNICFSDLKKTSQHTKDNQCFEIFSAVLKKQNTKRCTFQMYAFCLIAYSNNHINASSMETHVLV